MSIHYAHRTTSSCFWSLDFCSCPIYQARLLKVLRFKLLLLSEYCLFKYYTHILNFCQDPGTYWSLRAGRGNLITLHRDCFVLLLKASQRHGESHCERSVAISGIAETVPKHKRRISLCIMNGGEGLLQLAKVSFRTVEKRC